MPSLLLSTSAAAGLKLQPIMAVTKQTKSTPKPQPQAQAKPKAALKQPEESQKDKQPITVYELKLQQDGSPSAEQAYVRLPAPNTSSGAPYVLRLSIDAGGSACRDGSLMTNFPPAGHTFQRSKFWEHKLPNDPTHPLHLDLWITTPGVFEFYVEHAAPLQRSPYPSVEVPVYLGDGGGANEQEGDAKKKRVQGKHGYFNVDPLLSLPARAPILPTSPSSSSAPAGAPAPGSILPHTTIAIPQDALVLQSFVGKWAGPLSSWPAHLDLAKQSGYNMLHFLPLQVRGSSNSPYSLKDQMDFAADLFEDHAGEGEGAAAGKGAGKAGNKAMTMTREERFRTVGEWLKRIKNEWGMLSMTDIVLNHTANNTEWLWAHPEAAYNPSNSPHLTPAAELDLALSLYSAQLPSLGLPTRVESQTDVDALMAGVRTQVLDKLRLWEYYTLDVTREVQRFEERWDAWVGRGGAAEGAAKGAAANGTANGNGNGHASVTGSIAAVGGESLAGKTLGDAFALVQKWALRDRMTLAGRGATHVDTDTCVALFAGITGNGEGEGEGGGRSSEVKAAFRKALDTINVPLYRTYDEDVAAIMSNIEGRLKYMRLDPHGPRMGEITPESPLCEPYFTRLDPKDPRAKGQDPRSLALAHNGWIWAADPLVDFASSASRVYLRRELIAWGDCVKLRFGSGPDDSPFLWKHMTQYVESLASLFDGFRIDNCHSTPIHVGEYLLDAARAVNPNLYVCAELFTGSAEMDVYFVSRLGINSLIREMDNAGDAKEESRLLYRFGVNKPVGSMDDDCLALPATIVPPQESKEQPATIKPVLGSQPHALFMDLTHDNETPTAKRTTIDALTMGALVAFSWSAIGSTRGFDELYTKHLDVVRERRRYQTYERIEDAGIAPVRRVLNHLHTEMVLGGYSEGHVHQENDYIILHRIHPITHKGYVLIARTAFHHSDDPRGFINPIILKRSTAQFILGKTLRLKSDAPPEADDGLLHGAPFELLDIPAPTLRRGEDGDGKYTEIVLPDRFPQASILVFETAMEGMPADLEAYCASGAAEAVAPLDLVDLNILLYRADGEERDITGGNDGTYDIPQYGQLVYCGLQGWMAPLKSIMKHNDLGHALCAHLREGTWAFDYCARRLQNHLELFPRLKGILSWLQDRLDLVKQTVPTFMRPKYFALIISTAYHAARAQAISQMSNFVTEGHDFTKSLALVSVQLNGMVKSASLWPDKYSASMAAGLPFFTAGWARLWGRDVFISLRGLYLTTGMYEAAREHILSFGSTLKHGLIPNLLDSTRTPRYNCRDGPWFFAQNVQDYVNMVSGGEKILSEQVKRRFPDGETFVEWDSPEAFTKSNSVAELIQEILQRHASGIHFREHNAGPAIDNDMQDGGFNIDIEVDWSNGIIFGGNELNCGTWQDKMGSSAKAGNKGVPGSPRNGAAIEITALLWSTLRWVASLASKGKWPAKGVRIQAEGKERLVTYDEWAKLIKASFERCYWVPLDPRQDAEHGVDASLVARRGIYRDVYRSSKGREWADYQLRANFPIAMSVAPDLFDAEHALTALQAADNVLRGPIGMKTLDPKDYAYRGDYDNTDDSDNFNTAKGWSYHNGPEWGFLTGYFLRAYLYFDLSAGTGQQDKAKTFHRISSMMLEHKRHIERDPWAGLPELTNRDGAYCRDSCSTQAWSASCLLDVLQEMRRLQASK